MADQGEPGDPRQLLDQSQDKIAVLDDDGVFQYVNNAVERILGYAPAEVIGEDAFGFVHPEDVERARGTFERVTQASEERCETVEYRYRCVDGSWVWLESRMSNHVDSSVGGYVISSRDVTERKHAERDHQTISNYLREIARNTNDALWMFTADWEEVLFVNDAYEELYGRPASNLQDDATDFTEAVHPDDRDGVRAGMEAVSNGESIEVEHRVNPKDDYRRWIWVKAQPITRDGEVVRAVGFSRDVTDRRRRERQLRIMDRMLRHNLRNEMNVVIGHAREIKSKADTEIERHVDPIVGTCEGLLDAAEKERKVVELLLDRTPGGTVDLVGAVEGTVEWAEDQYPEATVESSVPAEAPASAVTEIDLALQELVQNAVEHARSTPTVSLEVECESESVFVRVEDSGPPIPKQETEVLTNEADEGEVFHGSGLGLWLVYLIVDLSGGDLEFDTNGEGNTVTIELSKPD